MDISNTHLIDLFLSSSSDSSEDEHEWLLLTRERRVTPKIKNYLENVVHLYTNEEFRCYFRVHRDTCKKLIQMFEDSEYYSDSPMVSAETHVLAFLWYACNKTTLRSVADRFGLAKSTLHQCNDRVINFLLNISPQVIRFPKTDAEKNIKAAEFEDIQGFPGVIGCIDGMFIDIKCPKHKMPSTFVNRHHKTSLVLQAICDANKKFIDCFTGVSGKCHDARVFKLSFIYPIIQQLGDQYHIIGDSAYPLSKNVLTPYKNYGNLTNIQQRYNTKLSATRVKVENSFSLLRARFRQLIRVEYTTVEKISKLIIACCVLHNLCIDDNDLYDNEFAPGENIFNFVDRNIRYEDNIMLQEGERKRDLVAQNL